MSTDSSSSRRSDANESDPEMMAGLPKEFSSEYRLTAAGCDAQRQLPLSVLVRQVIETATRHANILGIGYINLIKDDIAWVLGRLTIELRHMPEMHENYRLRTWIEGFNRHFSRRNFELISEDGAIWGYISSVWPAINPSTRQPANLSSIENVAEMSNPISLPIEPQNRIKPAENPGIEKKYEVETTDIDFNRHVTTARYVELIHNQLPLDFYDANTLRRFEISFHHEAVWGERLSIISGFTDEKTLTTEIRNGRGMNICSNRMIFERKEC